MKDLMIDIETLDKKNTACIVSIGACEFDINTGERGKEFYQVIEIEPNENQTISIDTMLWWMKQSKEAQSVFSEKQEKFSLEEALDSFKYCFGNDKKDFEFDKYERIWSKGNFDIPILENAFDSLDFKTPWKYWQICDMRTVNRLAGIKFKKENSHNALEDCYNQVNQLVESLKLLKNKG